MPADHDISGGAVTKAAKSRRRDILTHAAKMLGGDDPEN